MMKTRVLFVLLLLIPQIGLPQAGLRRADLPFTYRPVNRVFWTEFTELFEDKKYSEIISFADERLPKVNPDSLEQSEVQIALSEALIASNLSFAGTYLLSEIITSKQGTQAAYRSLMSIEKIMTTLPADEEGVVRELILDIDYTSPPKELAGFIAFHNGMFNRYNGFSNFTSANFKALPEGSYWDYKMRYTNSLEEVRRGRIDEATNLFKALIDDELTPVDIKRDSSHQYARLVFESGKFDEHYNILRNIELDPRERGLILLERAWSKYYLGDYGKALGLLTALEAPAFDPSRSPEAYILKMVIYKELCYYDAAFEVLEEFKNKFSTSITAIKNRQDLRKDQMLVNMSVIDRKFGRKVNFLNLLREERELLQKEFSGIKLYKRLLRAYDLKIKETLDKVNFELSDKIRDKANELLDWQEQISFLDYETRVDSLRVTRPPSEIIFKSEPIPLTRFDRVFWIFTGEYWLDELEDLKVFVESQCEKSGVLR